VLAVARPFIGDLAHLGLDLADRARQLAQLLALVGVVVAERLGLLALLLEAIETQAQLVEGLALVATLRLQIRVRAMTAGHHAAAAAALIAGRQAQRQRQRAGPVHDPPHGSTSSSSIISISSARA